MREDSILTFPDDPREVLSVDEQATFRGRLVALYERSKSTPAVLARAGIFCGGSAAQRRAGQLIQAYGLHAVEESPGVDRPTRAILLRAGCFSDCLRAAGAVLLAVAA